MWKINTDLVLFILTTTKKKTIFGEDSPGGDYCTAHSQTIRLQIFELVIFFNGKLILVTMRNFKFEH